MQWVRRILALVLTLLILAMPVGVLIFHPATPLPASWNPTKPLDPRAPINPLTGWKLTRALSDFPSCQNALDRASARYVVIPDLDDGEACHIRNQVGLSGLSDARLGTLDTRCAIALRLLMWERHSVQPAAEQIFGVGVRSIDHFGSYSCRTIAGSTRMSQHATANAVDIAGFTLTDGRKITLLRDWEGSDDASRFLRTVRRDACTWFNMVLSPDYNAAHRDHFHFDQGYWRGCR